MSAAGDNAAARGPTLGVLVPCRNEAAVIARKLANLARLEWPRAAGRHAVAIVDDGSTDGTAQLARDFAARADLPFDLLVLENRVRPGKSGAIQCGLDALCARAECFVLTDADVVCEEAALVHLARAFERNARLGMACGAQRFVRDLSPDGRARGADGAPCARAGGWYDAITSAVRALESRAGALFSVHGQLLAWRRALDLAPTPGYAADDLDLMLQARAAGSRVERVAAAVFFEVKVPAGPERDAQALRRARAYVQILGAPRWRAAAARGGLGMRAQAWAYRWLPTNAPWWLPLAGGACLLGVALGLGRSLVFSAAVAALVLLASAPARRLFALLGVIRRARRAEAAGPMGDRWETPRA